MKPGFSRSPADQRDRWMVSYVDVLTILLIFFLVAAARSLPTPVQAAPKPAIVIPVVAPKPAVNPDRAQLIYARELLREKGLEPKLEPRGLVISLPQVVLFSSGEDVVSSEALPTIEQIADVIRDLPNSVQLIGHADTIPIHNRRFSNNWELSMARSHSILELFSRRYGVPESRLSIASYGPYRPAAPNDTEDGRASNRRVEILILDAVTGDSSTAQEPLR